MSIKLFKENFKILKRFEIHASKNIFAFNHSDHGTKVQHMVQFSLASYMKYVMQEKNKGFICDHFHKNFG